MKDYVASGVWAVLSATLCLWIVDVSASIQLIRAVSIGGMVQATLRDYAGMFIAESQVAFGLILVAWLLGPLSAVVSRSRDWQKHAVALASAMVAAMTMVIVAITSWHLPIRNPREALTVGAVAGALLLVTIHIVLRKRDDSRWAFSGITRYLLFPALIVGHGNLALAKAIRGRWIAAWSDAATLLMLFVIIYAIGRLRSRSRRDMIGWLPMGAVVLMTFVSIVRFSNPGPAGAVVRGTTQPDRPNIVLIVLDTVRADHLQHYGYKRNTMPALENWADDALVFMRAVTPAGWTAPAHASMFSGLTVSQHGVHYEGSREQYYTNAFDGVLWLPEALRSEGYYCLAVSANPFSMEFGVTGWDDVHLSNRHEFYDGTIAGLTDHFSPLLNRVNEALRWRTPYLDAERIVDIITKTVPDGDAPVFLFVNMLDAHAPYNPPGESLDQLNLSPRHLYNRYRSHREITRMLDTLPDGAIDDVGALYDGELRWLDTHLERLLEWIDDRWGDDSIVIVTSDHGEELGEEGRVGHEYGLPQRLLHVPLLVRGPTTPAGEIRDIVSTRRIFDFLYLTGAGKRPGFDVFLPEDEYGLVSERYPTQHSILKSLGSDYGRPWISLFHGNHKVVGPSETSSAVFDISVSGFDQEVEVSADAQAESLQFWIEDYWDEFRDQRVQGDTTTISGELLKKLKSLGYVQ